MFYYTPQISAVYIVRCLGTSRKIENTVFITIIIICLFNTESNEKGSAKVSRIRNRVAIFIKIGVEGATQRHLYDFNAGFSNKDCSNWSHSLNV